MANRKLTTLGGNLFQIALRELGDATQWNRIAELSGTGPDPFLPVGVNTRLLIPPRDRTAGGGIYSPYGRPSLNPAYILDADGTILQGADGVNLIQRKNDQNSALTSFTDTDVILTDETGTDLVES